MDHRIVECQICADQIKIDPPEIPSDNVRRCNHCQRLIDCGYIEFLNQEVHAEKSSHSRTICYLCIRKMIEQLLFMNQDLDIEVKEKLYKQNTQSTFLFLELKKKVMENINFSKRGERGKAWGKQENLDIIKLLKTVIAQSNEELVEFLSVIMNQNIQIFEHKGVKRKINWYTSICEVCGEDCGYIGKNRSICCQESMDNEYKDYSCNICYKREIISPYRCSNCGNSCKSLKKLGRLCCICYGEKKKITEDDFFPYCKICERKLESLIKPAVNIEEMIIRKQNKIITGMSRTSERRERALETEKQLLERRNSKLMQERDNLRIEYSKLRTEVLKLRKRQKQSTKEEKNTEKDLFLVLEDRAKQTKHNWEHENLSRYLDRHNRDLERERRLLSRQKSDLLKIRGKLESENKRLKEENKYLKKKIDELYKKPASKQIHREGDPPQV